MWGDTRGENMLTAAITGLCIRCWLVEGAASFERLTLNKLT